MISAAIVLSVVLFFLSVPIFLVLGIGGSLVATLDLDLPWVAILQISFGAVSRHVLVAIPLFIFSGLLMLRGGVSRRLVTMCVALVGHWPGGLGVAMVLTMGCFAAFCGSILAAISAVGPILMPVMIEKGYSRPFVVVLAAAAGLLEALIPPSNTAIIFSSLTNVPVSQTFAAGLVPGLIFMVLLIAYVVWRCRNLERPCRATSRARLEAFVEAIPALLTPLIVLGGIYLGLLTPSESAAAASVWAMLLGFLVYRELTWFGVWETLQATAITTTLIFSIIAMATFLSVILTYTGLPQQIVMFFLGFGLTQLSFLIVVGIICLVLGTFLEVVPIFYLTIPIFLGVVASLGINVLHFYIVFVAFVGIGLLTPPVAVGVYTAASVIREAPDRALRAVPGFLLLGLIYAILMIALPQAATLLPELL